MIRLFLLVATAFHACLAESILIYPDSETAYNPRVPCVPPVDLAGKGKVMAIETSFTYRFGPWMRLSEGAKIEFHLRDNLRRKEKDLLSFGDGKEALILRVPAAFNGRVPELIYKREDKIVSSSKLSAPITGDWLKATLVWNAGEAVLSFEGKEVARVKLEGAFSPTDVTLQTHAIDDLHVSGDGGFSLDWEKGYAAALSPSASASGTEARVFGFDTFVVSQDEGNRDFPLIQILNPGPNELTASFDFEVQSEVHHTRQQWSQKITVPPRTAGWLPIAFAPALVTDVYHLGITSRGLGRNIAERRHFMYVQRRGEAATPAKFALHDSNRNTFGEWPDALPIGISHLYSRWRDTQGPPWIKDNHGDWGLSAEVPASEWNWDHRLDWAIGQGLIPYVCIESTPALPWMRERIIEGSMKPTKWDANGGFPKLSLFRTYVKELAKRYQGKVPMYEVENEPYLVHHAGKPPTDYTQIAKAVAEEIHQVDPQARIFINCGIGEYMAWTVPAIDAGSADFVQGISLHTYTTPRLPDQANLPKNLAGLHEFLEKGGRRLALVNSETGVYTALREDVDGMIPPARLAELIKQGTPNLSVASGWPNHAQDENRGATSMVQNAVENFAAGAEFFTFFGWNPKWPSKDWWTISKGSNGDACFSILSASKDNERTPSLFTLGVGVLTAQLEGIRIGSGRQIEQDGAIGALFDKEDGGQLAVLWSAMGKRSVLIESGDTEIEIVSLYGEARTSRSQGASDKAFHIVELSDRPIYLHLKERKFAMLPSPVLNIGQLGQEGNRYRLQYTLANQSDSTWEGEVSYSAPTGWKVSSATRFSLKPKQRKTLEVECIVPDGSETGARIVEASLRLPDGNPFSFPVTVAVKPGYNVPKLADASMLGGVEFLPVDRPDQVVVGRPPEMASLQEDQYWKGPRELSGAVQVGYTDEALLIKVRVRDVAARLPEPWPGVKGSCVEFFFDFRPPAARASRGAYEKGIYQIIVAPGLEAGRPAQIWHASERTGMLRNVTAESERIDAENYWVSLSIPWSSIGMKAVAGTSFGFDVSIDGPFEKESGRKSQMSLFGGASNSTDSSAFGNLTLSSKIQ